MSDEQGQPFIDEMKRLNRTLKIIAIVLIAQAVLLVCIFGAINTHR